MRDFRVFDFGYRAKWKTRKPRKCSFFFLHHIVTMSCPLFRVAHVLNSPIFLLFIKFFLTKLFFSGITRLFAYEKNSCSKNFLKLSSQIFMVKSFSFTLADFPVNYLKSCLEQLFCEELVSGVFR